MQAETDQVTPRLLTDPVSRLLKLYESDRPRVIVALAGYPGSGKTTAAKGWVRVVNRKLGDGQFMALGMDGFHLTKARLAAMNNPEEALARRGAPWTFDPDGLIAKLKELKSKAGSAPVGWPGFEHEIGDPVPDALIVPPGCPLILVEGIYTLLRQERWADLDEIFDETWFLDTSLETSMQRLYLRHQKAWGMSETEARKQADGNDRLNCEHIRPCRETADFIVC
jgi:pantothenate kinase